MAPFNMAVLAGKLSTAGDRDALERRPLPVMSITLMMHGAWDADILLDRTFLHRKRMSVCPSF